MVSREVPEGTRWCPECESAVKFEDFTKNAARSSGFGTWCKPCTRANNRGRYFAEGGFSELRKKSSIDNRRRYRKELIDAYGGKCSCCGEDWEDYLQLDHVNNDGKTHRNTVPHVWADLRKRGYPQDGYQLLCANCHAAKTKNRPCKPH